jgi:MAternally-affected-uncoordination protein
LFFFLVVVARKREHCLGLLFYNELLHIFYQLRVCDYKNANQHVDKLDAAMKADSHKMREAQRLTNELNALNQSLSRPDLPNRERSLLSSKQAQIQDRISSMNNTNWSAEQPLEPAYFGNTKRPWQEKLVLAPPPIDGEWLPKSAVYALVDLMVVIFGRPRGLFKECAKRIQSGMRAIQGLIFLTKTNFISFIFLVF